MVISAIKSGGFAGVTKDLGTLDTACLKKADRLTIEYLVNESGFFRQQADFVGEIGADFFHITITIRDNDRQHSITFADSDHPESKQMREILKFFIKHVKTKD